MNDATLDEISWAILFLLSSPASYIDGVLLTVDGGWTVTPGVAKVTQ